MYYGNCLCGTIKYEVQSDLKTLLNCHCKFCRRAHGATFVTLLLMQDSDLRLIQGEDSIGKFHIESKGVDRCFCINCGTRLYNHVVAAGRLALVVATLESDEVLHPIAHCNTESKCSWYKITDNLPQFLQAPSSAELNELLSAQI